jgi:hypothetical protein
MAYYLAAEIFITDISKLEIDNRITRPYESKEGVTNA